MKDNKKRLLIISAKHKYTNKYVNMKYYSVKQAKYYNKYYDDFKIIVYIGDNDNEIYIL